MKFKVLFIILLLAVAGLFVASGAGRKFFSLPMFQYTREDKSILKGVWVTVFSSRKVLYSRQAADDLLGFCLKNDISEVYLQVYRAGLAYYDSGFVENAEYGDMVKSFGGDPIDYLLAEANSRGIRVHAWVNILSLAKSQKAPIIRKYGTGILTKDRGGRLSIRTDLVDISDKYYLRDDQLFLEPGDERVSEWTLGVIDEIMVRYPLFSGLHLDYIRYPYPVPFIPDSRFSKFGVSYGFGERSVQGFRQATGLNPLKDDMYKNDLHLKWDNWKRDQVTDIVSRISALVKGRANGWILSCAVVPAQERAYSIAYQDWPLWLEKGMVDHVVLMNYTKDLRLAAETVRGALAYRGKGKVYAGVGTFLFKDLSDARRMNKAVMDQHPDGLVMFSYDEVADLGLDMKALR
jgi:uncharacterized lipoprotein YddW (UPF0748 family)